MRRSHVLQVIDDVAEAVPRRRSAVRLKPVDPADRFPGCELRRVFAARASRRRGGSRRGCRRPRSMPQRHQLLFGLARMQRVVDLLGDEARPVRCVGDSQRLHDVPGRKSWKSRRSVPCPASPGVSRASIDLLERRLTVPLVRPGRGRCRRSSAAAGESRIRAMMCQRLEAAVVRALADREANLAGDQHPIVTAVGQCLAEDRLGVAAAIDVGGIDKIDAVIEAKVDLPLRPLECRWRPRRSIVRRTSLCRWQGPRP